MLTSATNQWVVYDMFCLYTGTHFHILRYAGRGRGDKNIPAINISHHNEYFVDRYSKGLILNTFQTQISL
jgi:hypothetical protein